MDVIRKAAKRLRQRAGLNMCKAMRISGIAKSQISKLESDKDANPTVNTLKALAKAYKVDITQFFYA